MASQRRRRLQREARISPAQRGGDRHPQAEGRDRRSRRFGGRSRLTLRGRLRAAPFFFITKGVSAMTTYTVYFRTDAQRASVDIEAKTPKQALTLARKLDPRHEL